MRFLRVYVKLAIMDPMLKLDETLKEQLNALSLQLDVKKQFGNLLKINPLIFK